MGDEGTWLGYWWAEESLRVGGRLTIDEEGRPALEALGSLLRDYEAETGPITIELGEDVAKPGVFGETPDGFVTLLNPTCHFPLLPGGDVEQWQASAMLWGDGRDRVDEDGVAVFDGGRVRIDGLDIVTEAIAHGDEGEQSDDRLCVPFRTDVLAECELANVGRLMIVQQPDTERHAGVSIAWPVTAVVELEAAVRWQVVLKTLLEPIQGLVWLSSLRAGRVREVWLRTGAERDPWARLVAPLLQPPARRSQDLLRRDLLFTMNELPGGASRGLQTWFSTWDDLRHVVTPVVARQRSPFAYVNDRFLTAAASLEAFHLHGAGSIRDVSRPAHRERVTQLKEVLAAHAPQLAEWAIACCQQENKKPFKARIIEFAADFPRVTSQLVGEHLDEFAGAVVEARNGHAHALPNPLRLGQPEGGLYFAAEGLVWLMRCALMAALGFDTADVEARVLRHPNFDWSASRLREVTSEIQSA